MNRLVKSFAAVPGATLQEIVVRRFVASTPAITAVAFLVFVLLFLLGDCSIPPPIFFSACSLCAAQIRFNIPAPSKGEVLKVEGETL